MNRLSSHLQLFATILILPFFVGSCLFSSSDDNRGPIKPLKLLAPGSDWAPDFNEGDFQNGVIQDGKLYCNTINSGDVQDYFYCFNLKTGKVEWAHEIEDFASQPAVVSRDRIYFSTFVGHLHCLDLQGHCIWNKKCRLPYGAHYRDLRTGNLIVLSVVSGVEEYDSRNGQIINSKRNLDAQKQYLREEYKKILLPQPYKLIVPSGQGSYELEISYMRDYNYRYHHEISIAKRKLE